MVASENYRYLRRCSLPRSGSLVAPPPKNLPSFIHSDWTNPNCRPRLAPQKQTLTPAPGHRLPERHREARSIRGSMTDHPADANYTRHVRVAWVHPAKHASRGLASVAGRVGTAQDGKPPKSRLRRGPGAGWRIFGYIVRAGVRYGAVRSGRSAPHPGLARMPHTLPTTARDEAASTSLRLLTVLDMLFEYASAR